MGWLATKGDAQHASVLLASVAWRCSATLTKPDRRESDRWQRRGRTAAGGKRDVPVIGRALGISVVGVIAEPATV